MSDNPKIEQMSPQNEIDPEPWQIGGVVNGSKKPWRESTWGPSCIECGLVVRDYWDEEDAVIGEGV